VEVEGRLIHSRKGLLEGHRLVVMPKGEYNKTSAFVNSNKSNNGKSKISNGK